MADGVSLIGVSAFALGMLHALEPGHGKSLMAGALIGTRRKWLDPIMLAASAAVGHSLGIALIATVSYLIAYGSGAENIRHTVELIAAGLVLTIGGIRLYKSSKALLAGNGTQAGEHCCSCHHPDDKVHIEEHGGKSARFIPLLGVTIGLIPCPTAFALSLSAVNAGAISQAVVLSLIFGLGIATTLAVIGLILTHAQEKLIRFNSTSGFARFAPLVSSVIICLIGVFMFVHTLSEHS